MPRDSQDPSFEEQTFPEYDGFELEQLARIHERVRAADAGEFASDEEVREVFAKYRAYQGEPPDESPAYCTRSESSTRCTTSSSRAKVRNRKLPSVTPVVARPNRTSSALGVSVSRTST